MAKQLTDTVKIAKLRRFNFIMAGLHAIQAGLILFLSNNFSVNLTTTYLIFNPSTNSLDSTTSVLRDIHFGPAIALFLFLSAAAHFFVATVGFDRYKAGLKSHHNYSRWIEYSLSASLMIILIALLAGVYDISTLLCMFVLTAVMNLCGLLMEMYNRDRKDTSWSAYWIGCLAGIVPWIVIAIYFAGSAHYGAGTGSIPTFVYWIYGTIFVFFNIFALNMYLQYKRIGPWRDYLFGERVYIILSLVAKSALAWQIFFGTLRPM